MPERTVTLDPERLPDCQRLSDALYVESGIEIDPGDALCTLVDR